MRFWEENRALCYGVLISAVVLIVLWPSFGGGRPGIVSFFKSNYKKLEEREKSLDKEIERYFSPKNSRMSTEVSRARSLNEDLEGQFRQLRTRAIFIPPAPFRIPAFEPRPDYKLLKIQTETHQIGLVQYASLREIEIVDEFFGLDQKGTPPEKEKLPLLLRQMAAIDDLVRKAVDCGVQRIDRVIPMEPLKAGPLNKAHFLKAYPIRLEMTASYKTVMEFINTLDGFHGTVRSVGSQAAKGAGETVIEIDIGSKQGLSKEHAVTFTIFDDVPDKDDGLRYKGRAYVQEILDDHCVARIPAEALPSLEDDKEMAERKVAKGDCATTNFYTLMDLKIDAEAPREKTTLVNKTRAVITVGCLGLLDTDSPGGGKGPKAPTTAPPPRRWGGF